MADGYEKVPRAIGVVSGERLVQEERISSAHEGR